jgi:hypothetical protein
LKGLVIDLQPGNGLMTCQPLQASVSVPIAQMCDAGERTQCRSTRDCGRAVRRWRRGRPPLPRSRSPDGSAHAAARTSRRGRGHRAAGSAPAADLEFWWWGQQNYPGPAQRCCERCSPSTEGERGDDHQGRPAGHRRDHSPPTRRAPRPSRAPTSARCGTAPTCSPTSGRGNVAPLERLRPRVGDQRHWLESKFTSTTTKIWASGVSGDGAAISTTRTIPQGGLAPTTRPRLGGSHRRGKKAQGRGFIPSRSALKDGLRGVVLVELRRAPAGGCVTRETCSSTRFRAR